MGSGAWGVALAIHISHTCKTVWLWSRKECINPTTRIMPRLPCYALPENITVSNTFPKKIDLIFLTVPVQFVRSVLPIIPLDIPVVICCKGVETNSLKFPSEIIEEFYPNRLWAVLSGPNFAAEVAQGLPTATVIASRYALLTKTTASILSTSTFRVYANKDPIGVEIGGAAKNVIAIASGATMGAGLGENARASLITRGITELSRLSIGLGGEPNTITGLAGVGDLILTCTGATSRNYSLGYELGKGRHLSDILKERNTVTEGVLTAPAILQRAKHHKVDTPIIQCVNQLLQGEITVDIAKEKLMGRPLAHE